MSQDSKFVPLIHRVSDEVKAFAGPLKNVRVRLIQETKKGRYTAVVDVDTLKQGKIVAKKTDKAPAKSIQKAKQAVMKQLIKQKKKLLSYQPKVDVLIPR